MTSQSDSNDSVLPEFGEPLDPSDSLFGSPKPLSVTLNLKGPAAFFFTDYCMKMQLKKRDVMYAALKEHLARKGVFLD